MPKETIIELRIVTNHKGNYHAIAFQDGSKLQEFDLEDVDFETVIALYKELQKRFPTVRFNIDKS